MSKISKKALTLNQIMRHHQAKAINTFYTLHGEFCKICPNRSKNYPGDCLAMFQHFALYQDNYLDDFVCEYNAERLASQK